MSSDSKLARMYELRAIFLIKGGREHSRAVLAARLFDETHDGQLDARNFGLYQGKDDCAVLVGDRRVIADIYGGGDHGLEMARWKSANVQSLVYAFVQDNEELIITDDMPATEFRNGPELRIVSLD